MDRNHLGHQLRLGNRLLHLVWIQNVLTALSWNFASPSTLYIFKLLLVKVLKDIRLIYICDDILLHQFIFKG